MDLEKFFTETIGLENKELVTSLCKFSKIKHYKRNQIIISKSEFQDEILINVSGAYRGFYYDSEGNEITNSICNETGYIITSCNAICEKSKSYLKAITDVTAVAIKRDKAHILSSLYPELTNFYNEFLLRASDKHLNAREVCFCCNATEKYQWFLESYPGLAEYMFAKDIASFLQMTPVTLSRARKELSQNRG